MSNNSIPDATGSTLLAAIISQPTVVVSGPGLVECPECDGSGEIHTNPWWPRDPQCDDSHECGLCNGDGSLTAGQAADRFASQLHDELQDLLLRAAHALVTEHPALRDVWAGNGFPLSDAEVMAEWLNDLGQSARLSADSFMRGVNARQVVATVPQERAA